MGFSSLFGFGSSGGQDELPNIFPLGMLELDFVRIDVISIYTKILTDVVERTDGISEDEEHVLWDNCMASESSYGLLHLIARAMYDMGDLFLVYDKALKVLRKANGAEQSQIRADYEKQAESSAGTYISFKKYYRTEMLKLYSCLEYCTVNGLNKSVRLSTAIQLKINDLRGSVSLSDSAAAKSQAGLIAKGLAAGKDVMLDAKDTVETATPDISSTQSSMELLNQKRSFYLGMPASYITGEAPKGLGDSGKGDAKAIERGLKNYYFAIIRPVFKSIFGVDTTFKSEDFDQLEGALEALKTFELTDGVLLSEDNKRVIVNKLFGLCEDEQGDEAPVDPNAANLKSSPKQDPNAAPPTAGPEKVPAVPAKK